MTKDDTRNSSAFKLSKPNQRQHVYSKAMGKYQTQNRSSSLQQMNSPSSGENKFNTVMRVTEQDDVGSYGLVRETEMLDDYNRHEMSSHYLS